MKNISQRKPEVQKERRWKKVNEKVEKGLEKLKKQVQRRKFK